MGYKAIVQIALIVVALILVFVYIKPTFAQIAQIQSDVTEYKDAVSKASEFNQLLDKLARKERSYSDQDRAALDRFLPSTVDYAQVMHDLESLFEIYDIELDKLSVDSESETSNVDVYIEGEEMSKGTLPYSDFSLTVTDSYDKIKQLLALIESNSYPLEIVTMDLAKSVTDADSQISQRDDKFVCSLVLRVYSLNSTPVPTLSD